MLPDVETFGQADYSFTAQYSPHNIKDHGLHKTATCTGGFNPLITRRMGVY
jgi:hypothetical protein